MMPVSKIGYVEMSSSGTRGYPRAFPSGSGQVGLGPIKKIRARAPEKSRKNGSGGLGLGSGLGPIHPYWTMCLKDKAFRRQSSG